MKTPYEKYEAARTRLWDKFKANVRDVCTHPEEYVTSKNMCDEDEYGRTYYNQGTTFYKCSYCGETWNKEWKKWDK